MMDFPGAILFDLDGVVVQTRDYHFRAWARVAEDEGIALSRQEYDQYLRGVRKRELLRYLTRGRDYSEEQFQSLLERRKRYFLEGITAMSEADLIPGFRELLTEIEHAGIKTAVASGGKHTRLILEQLALLDAFDGIADAYSVSNNKPAADIYLFAAGLVNRPVASCLAIDDKATNVQNIKLAGMCAIGIGEKEHFHPDDLVLPSLAHVRLCDIIALCDLHVLGSVSESHHPVFGRK